MSIRILCPVVAILLVAADPPTDAAKNDLSKIQGEWVVQQAQRNGKDAPEKARESIKIKIDGSKITISDAQSVRDETAEITLDPSKSPATIDLKPSRPGGEELVPGIYKLDGEMLTLCWTKQGGGRPTEFSTKAGDDHVLFVLKRAPKK
jgi:uncharacterized protein (TIGR03067 family)